MDGSSRIASTLLPLLVLPAAAVAAFSANPGLSVAAVLTLAAIIALLWRKSEPPVLLFITLWQWLQASIRVFHADLLGVQVWTLSDAHSYETATGLTLIWTLATALGMRAMLMGQNKQRYNAALEAVQPVALFRIYLVWTLLLASLDRIAVGGFRQLFVAAADMRWAVVFALFWTVFRTKRHFGMMAFILIVEVATGFLSYFSSFKTPVYLLALAVPAGNYRVRPRHVVGGLVVGALALYLGVIWSAVKIEYRHLMSAGTMEQGSSMGQLEQAETLIDLLGTIDNEKLGEGADQLVDRIAYVDYFALAMDFVPAVRAHEDGLLWANALRHVLMPRLFFPDKPDLEADTIITERYTGVDVAYGDLTTSISLGTAAESYVDYGDTAMFIPAFAIGMLCGSCYRRFVSYGRNAALALGFGVAQLVPLATIELTPTKLLGGALTRLVVALLLWQVILRVTRRAAPAQPASILVAR